MFGSDHVYAADQFVEMSPPSADPGYLRNLSSAMITTMMAVDPAAVWVMQSWAFNSVSMFASNITLIHAYLSGAVKTRNTLRSTGARLSLFYLHQSPPARLLRS